jgi:hypothetical protein
MRALPVLVALLLWALHHHVTCGYLISADERQYLSQSLLFARGELAFHGDIPAHWLMEHTWHGDGTWMSKYPPGTSLILLLAGLCGDPALAGAISGAACLVLCHRLLRDWTHPAVALWACAMVALDPIFWGYAISLFSQVHASALSLLACVLVGRGSRPAMFATLILLTVVRPTDGACAACAVSLVQAGHRRWGDALLPWPALAAGVALVTAFNLAAVGQLTPALYGDKYFTLLLFLRGGIDLSLTEYVTWYMRGLLDRQVALFCTWTSAYGGHVFFHLGLLGLWTSWRRADRAALLTTLTLVGVIVGFHSFLPFLGWPHFGLRYQSVLIPVWSIPLAALGQRSLELAGGRPAGRRLVAGLAVALVGWQLLVTADKVTDLRARYTYIKAVFTTIEARCPERSVVRFEEPDKEVRRYFITRDTFLGVTDPSGAAHPTLGSGRLLIGPDWRDEDEAWLARHPEHTLCDVTLPGFKVLSWSQKAWWFVPFQGDHEDLPPVRPAFRTRELPR